MLPFRSVLCHGTTISTRTNNLWCLHKDFCVRSMLRTWTNFPLQHPSDLEKCYYPLFAEKIHQLLRQHEAVGGPRGPKTNALLNIMMLQRATPKVKQDQGHLYFFNVFFCSSVEAIAGDTEGKRRRALHVSKLQPCPSALET